MKDRQNRTKSSRPARLEGPKGNPEGRRNGFVAPEWQHLLGNQAMVKGLEAGSGIVAVQHLLPLRPILGNQGTTRSLQAKLRVNTPADQNEQEADRMAEHLVRMTEPPVAARQPSHAAPSAQRKCACGGSCAKCQVENTSAGPGILQTKGVSAGRAGQAVAPPSVLEVLNSLGRPLDRDTRAFMEPRFGRDFSHVRVHADTQAAAPAKEIHARAYTAGRDVVFASNQFAPKTPSGKKLLAHELTHVVQQGAETKTIQRAPNNDNDDDDEPPVVPHRPTSMPPLSSDPRSCPGGAVPYNGVCLTEEVLTVLPEADYDATRAQKIVRSPESKAEGERKRRERTIKRFASKEPYALYTSYQYALGQYVKDPRTMKEYDLETLQHIAEQRIPNAALAHAQDVREYLSVPTWTAGEQVQMDELKNDIKDWTLDEQELARYLLWRWFEIAKGGQGASPAKHVIIEMTAQFLEQWLRAADMARKKECREDPPGFVEKLYRIHGIDRCQPWFDDEHYKDDPWFHGPSELIHFRRQMRLRLSDDESPRSLVYECVKQYRSQTNAEEALHHLQAQAIAGMVTHVAAVGSMASLRFKNSPPVSPPGSDVEPPQHTPMSRIGASRLGKVASALARGLDENLPGIAAGDRTGTDRPVATLTAPAPRVEPAPTPDAVRPARTVNAPQNQVAMPRTSPAGETGVANPAVRTSPRTPATAPSAQSTKPLEAAPGSSPRDTARTSNLPGSAAVGRPDTNRPVPTTTTSAPRVEPAPTPDADRSARAVTAPAKKIVKLPPSPAGRSEVAAPVVRTRPRIPAKASAAQSTAAMKRLPGDALRGTARPSSTGKTVRLSKRSQPQVTALPRSSPAFSEHAAASVTPSTPAPTSMKRVRANTQPFLDDQLKRASNTAHPLHDALVVPAVGPDGKQLFDKDNNPVFTWRTTTFTAKSGRVMTGRYQGNEHGIVVQVGHRDAFASGAPEVFMLEDADTNQLGGQTIESRGATSKKIAVEVDGVVVDQTSLEQWERLGQVKTGTAAKAKNLSATQ
jgi:hypothetical protein